MRAYAPNYSQAALDALLSASKRRLVQVRAAIDRLCRGVPTAGDYRVQDAAGRVWDVTLIDGVVITYWVDHAVCEVKLGLIEWVE
jgi:hypothetical protein